LQAGAEEKHTCPGNAIFENRGIEHCIAYHRLEYQYPGACRKQQQQPASDFNSFLLLSGISIVSVVMS
jgi:hypothetical protein